MRTTQHAERLTPARLSGGLRVPRRKHECAPAPMRGNGPLRETTWARARGVSDTGPGWASHRWARALPAPGRPRRDARVARARPGRPSRAPCTPAQIEAKRQAALPRLAAHRAAQGP